MTTCQLGAGCLEASCRRAGARPPRRGRLGLRVHESRALSCHGSFRVVVESVISKIPTRYSRALARRASADSSASRRRNDKNARKNARTNAQERKRPGRTGCHSGL